MLQVCLRNHTKTASSTKIGTALFPPKQKLHKPPPTIIRPFDYSLLHSISHKNWLTLKWTINYYYQNYSMMIIWSECSEKMKSKCFAVIWCRSESGTFMNMEQTDPNLAMLLTLLTMGVKCGFHPPRTFCVNFRCHPKFMDRFDQFTATMDKYGNLPIVI